MEIEALESIYLDDFTKTSDIPIEFTLQVYPLASDGSDGGVTLRCSLPETYPEARPEVSVECIKGLTEDQIAIIQQLVHEAAEENVGMPMIYMLETAAKGWLVDNNKEAGDGSAYAQMLKRKAAEQEKVDEEKAVAAEAAAAEDDGVLPVLEGTPVTPESFAEWFSQYQQERAELEPADAGSSKLSGPLLWFVDAVVVSDSNGDGDTDYACILVVMCRSGNVCTKHSPCLH